MHSRWRCATLGLLFTAVACGGIAEPDWFQYELPDSLSFVCGQWYPNAPAVERGLFDVLWEAEGERPSPDTDTLIAALAGIVVHRFHVPITRVVLAPEQVPRLDANRVFGVSDAHEFLVTVIVSFDHSITQEDLAFFEELQGVVRLRWGTGALSVLSAVVPDEAIPRLRARAGIDRVTANTWSCLGG